MISDICNEEFDEYMNSRLDTTLKKIKNQEVNDAMEHDDIRYNENYGRTIHRQAIIDMVFIILDRKHLKLVDLEDAKKFITEDEYDEEEFMNECYDYAEEYATNFMIRTFFKNYTN